MTFQPGQSGNPAGRPRGSRNKRTIVVEKIFDDHAADVTSAAIDLATSGNPAALRICMDRISPPLRHRLLDFHLPVLASAADAVAAMNAIIQGAAHGELTVPEAQGLMKLVRAFVSVLAVAERERRTARRAAQEGVQDGAYAADRPDRDALRQEEHQDDDQDDHHDDDPIILAPCPPHAAVDPTPTRQSDHQTQHTIEEPTDDDDDCPFLPAPSRPHERAQNRAQDHAAHPARGRRGCADLRKAPRRYDGERASDRDHRGDVAA